MVKSARAKSWSLHCLEEESRNADIARKGKGNIFCDGWTKKERYLTLALSTSLFLLIVLSFAVAAMAVKRVDKQNQIEHLQSTYEKISLDCTDVAVAAPSETGKWVPITPERFVLYHRMNRNDICLTKGCVKAAAALIQSMNESIDPCDDFYEFACGTFVDEAIVLDEDGAITSLSSISRDQKYKLRLILEANSTQGIDTPATMLAKNLYTSCMDTESIKENGLQPLRDIIETFGGWPVVSGSSWNEGNFSFIEAMYLSRSIGLPINTLFNLNVAQDLTNSTERILWVSKPSFPISREFLVKGLNDSIVQAYLKFSIDVAILMGAEASQAEEEMKKVLQFQIEMAESTLSQEEARKVENSHNIKTVQEMQAIVPEIPWLEYINRMLPGNITVDENEILNVDDIGYMTNFSKLLNSTSKRDLANYVIWKIIVDSTPYLSEDIRELQFEVTRVLSGTSSLPSRWEECVELVVTTLPYAIGNLYIKNYFDEDSKEQIESLVFYVRKAFDEILKMVDWMDPETKERALIKSNAMKPFIAYSEDLLNDTIVTDFYSGLQIEAETQLIYNMLNESKFAADYEASLLGKIINASHWTERPNPAVVNAFYNFGLNTLEFPAGILQGHFFQPDRPKYMNYGTIGLVIGHEITHGFDDQGRNFDECGNYRNWWENSTEKNFNERAQCIVDQYSDFVSPETGLNLNGENTQGENIADNGGIKAAYRAYAMWTRRNGMESRLPGLSYTPNQLFWISSAQVWCSKYRTEFLKETILTDVHSPGRFRIIGPFRNSEDFSRDFRCRSGSKMNPRKKCTVW